MNDEQIKELEAFAVGRKSSAAEYFRPAYHFTPPVGRSNDPNGLCFWRGKWHLFYQFNPPGAQQPSWGHACSRDLVHWQDLPVAISPGPETGSWSGATWVEDDRVIAMYHGYGIGNMVAVSEDDDLINWVKISGNTVLPNPLPIWCCADGGEECGGRKAPCGAINIVYDPCIWKKGEYYYSISGGARRREGSWRRHRSAYLFRSRDLTEWEYMHEFIEDDYFGYPGDDCGCPYFMPIGDKHILIHFSHRGASHYMIGDYDQERDKFRVLDSGHFGFGSTFPGGIFAPSAFPDGMGGVILMLTLAPGHRMNGEDVRQVFSLPRRLTLADRELCMSPVESVTTLRSGRKHFENIFIARNQEFLLKDCGGRSAELAVEILWEPGDWQMFEVNLLCSPDGLEKTSIRFHKHAGCRVPDSVPDGEKNFGTARVESILSIDTSHSSALPCTASRMPENAPVAIRRGENVKLRIFIDRSIVEVFANDRQCASCRVFPGMAESTGIAFSVRGGDATVAKCDFWEMRGIF